ncbi:MAG: exodeoxyribonuclease III [Microscillaceae bacterium]
MRIITYNVNGIRAALQKGFREWLIATQADIVCLQEIKVQGMQIPKAVFEDLGYHTFWHPAQKKGYSGVAILSKVPPQKIVYGYGPDSPLTDEEGRVLRADFANFSVMSVYMPSGSSSLERQDFKMEWLAQFYAYIAQLKEELPPLLISGDYNICHQPIDIHNPKANANSSGFLPEERTWLGQFFDLGFVDTFRYLNPEPHHYTWWSYRSGARTKNLGWRIDYHAWSQEAAAKIQRAIILKEAFHSDHCPVLVELEVASLSQTN